MADIQKNERIIQLLVELLKRPKKSFTITELLQAIDLPKTQRRNVQRDMVTLMTLPGNLVVCDGHGTRKTYRTGLNVLDKLTLPNFEDVMLQFVFLQNIANIYPGTADLIEELVDKIQSNLPRLEQDKLKDAYKDIHSRVFFVGGYRKIDDAAGEKLHTILLALRDRHELSTLYKTSGGETKKGNRIPVGIAMFQGEIYIACVRRNDPRAVYTIKLNRIISVEPTKVLFVENSETRTVLESIVKDFSLFNKEDNCVEKIHLTFPLGKRDFVEDNPFHSSMRIREGKKFLHVTMHVNVTLQLKQWLLFHTENGVTVVKPEHLRKELLKIGLEIAEKYG